MREMKNSGVAWIGDVPENWKVLRNKNLIYEINEKCTDTTDLPLLSVSEYYGVAPRADKIHDGQIVSRAETFEGYKICHQDDVVMNIMLAWKRAQAVSSFNGIVSPAYCVYRKKNNSKLDMTFFNYLIRSDLYISVFKRFSTGIIDSRLRLYPEKFLALHSHVPPTYEQHKIAKHLNKACNNIENLINNQEQQIEKLKQYKQSLITEVVTKGLNPDVPMKDSGIEWIGKIPNNWQIVRFRFIAKITTGNQDTQNATADGNYPFYVRSPIVEKSDTYTFEGPGILMAGDGAGAGRVFHLVDGKYAVHQRVYRFYDFKFIVPELLKLFLETQFSTVMDYGSAKTTVPSVRLPMIQDFPVCIPTKAEQMKMITYLRDKIKKIDSLIAIKQEKINKLNDYKKSLIYEYVTGKREVC